MDTGKIVIAIILIYVAALLYATFFGPLILLTILLKILGGAIVTIFIAMAVWTLFGNYD